MGQLACTAASTSGSVIRSVRDTIGLKHPIVDLPGVKDVGHLGQALAQGAGIAQPAGGQPLADPQRRGHLSGHRLHGVDGQSSFSEQRASR